MATYGTLNIENITSSTGGVISPNITSLRNRIINGAMVIDQRNSGGLITNPTNQQYLVDRWQYEATQTSKVNIQQNYNSVTPPVGFTNYLGVLSNSAYSIVATDIFDVRQMIEAFNVSDLGWGTANAKSVTLSFQVYSSLTGTFGGALKNSNQDRSYPFTYSIPVANTWTTISVTIAGDTSGTWINNTNGVGIRVVFGLGVGSTYSGTAGTWSGSNYYSATGATSVVGTNGATFYVTGVQLEVGAQATSFDYRPYGTELALCQRYYEKSYAQSVAPANGALSDPRTGIVTGIVTGIEESNIFRFSVTKRTASTITFYNGSSFSTPGQWAVFVGGWVQGATATSALYDNYFTVQVSASGFTANTSAIVSGSWSASAEI